MAETKTRRKRSREGRAATVVDVARLAGVAANTVSRVLNHPEQVAEDTRARVLEAIRVTGYVPNLLAAGVRSARSKLIAAVVPTVSGPMFLDTIQGLTETLEQHGYQLILGQAGYDGAREDELLNAIIGRRPAGIALIGIAHTADSRRRLMASGIPIVETWDLTPTPIDMVVGFPHEEIGIAVCEFLLAKGRKRLAVVSGRDERAARRTAAFQAAARKQGVEPPVAWTPAPGTFEGGRAGAAELLHQADARPDAIFCSSDLLALGVVAEARARGVDVPGDLAVVGFGNLNFSVGVTPPLTTVKVDGPRIGRVAASMLVDRAEGRAVAQTSVDVRFSILERAST
jgi:LacI family gluconate utilization system Gnt-I transcriptional repressor